MEDAYWDGYDDAEAEGGSRRGKLRRDKIDGVVAGVCAGLANYTGIDVIWVRAAFLLSLFLTGGVTFWIYVLMWLVVPSDKRAPYRRAAREAVRTERRRERGRKRTDTTRLTDVRSKFRSLETRMQDLEKSITSKEWQLRRDFRDLEDE